MGGGRSGSPPVFAGFRTWAVMLVEAVTPEVVRRSESAGFPKFSPPPPLSWRLRTRAESNMRCAFRSERMRLEAVGKHTERMCARAGRFCRAR